METKIVYLGFRNEKKWPHFAWSVSVNGESFEYKTGTGHKTPLYKGESYYDGMYRTKNKKPENSIMDASAECWVHIPKIDEVLNSLFLDVRGGEYSFDDFCDNLGYSNDSLKALDVYRECMDLGKRLRKALGGEYHKEKERIEALCL